MWERVSGETSFILVFCSSHQISPSTGFPPVCSQDSSLFTIPFRTIKFLRGHSRPITAYHCSRGNQPLRSVPAVRLQVLLSFPTQALPAGVCGATSSYSNPCFLHTFVDPMWVLLPNPSFFGSPQRECLSVGNVQVAVHNSAIKMKSICLKHIFIEREIDGFGGNNALLQPSCTTFNDMEPTASPCWSYMSDLLSIPILNHLIFLMSLLIFPDVCKCVHWKYAYAIYVAFKSRHSEAFKLS